MPKYLITIVENEDAYTGADEADFGAVMQMHGDFAESVSAAGGEILGGEALQPIPTATFLRNTRTDDVTVVDKPVARRQGGSRRLLPGHCEGRCTGTRVRQALPRTARVRRVAPDLGVRRLLSGLPDEVARATEAAQREHWGRVLAATLRLARDLDIAEEATADAFLLAWLAVLRSWDEGGQPGAIRPTSRDRG